MPTVSIDHRDRSTIYDWKQNPGDEPGFFIAFSRPHAKPLGMSLAQELVGTWDLISAEDLMNNKWSHRYGEHPKGYFTFGGDGHVSVQFMKFPVNDENKTFPLNSYLAYFGTYEVDENASLLTIKIEGALHPHLIGTTQKRPFRIEGDKLYIGEDSLGYRRVFSKRCPEGSGLSVSWME